jgi:hypothetical protein
MTYTEQLEAEIQRLRTRLATAEATIDVHDRRAALAEASARRAWRLAAAWGQGAPRRRAEESPHAKG